MGQWLISEEPIKVELVVSSIVAAEIGYNIRQPFRHRVTPPVLLLSPSSSAKSTKRWQSQVVGMPI